MVFHNELSMVLAWKCCDLEKVGVFWVKNVNVCKFSDFDKICFLSATMIIKNNFGLLKNLMD